MSENDFKIIRIKVHKNFHKDVSKKIEKVLNEYIEDLDLVYGDLVGEKNISIEGLWNREEKYGKGE